MYMIITKPEAEVLWISMAQTGQMVNGMTNAGVAVQVPQEKTFPQSQWKNVGEIFDQLKKNCVDANDQFKEGEISLSLDQRKLLKDTLNGREWSVKNVVLVLSVITKLETE